MQFVLLFDVSHSRTISFLFFSRKFVFVRVFVSKFVLLFHSEPKSKFSTKSQRRQFLSAFYARSRKNPCCCSRNERVGYIQMPLLTQTSNWWYNSENRKCEIKRDCQVRALSARQTDHQFETFHIFFRRRWRCAQNLDGIQLIFSIFFFFFWRHRNWTDNYKMIKKERVFFVSHPFIVTANSLSARLGIRLDQNGFRRRKMCCRNWMDVDDSLK